MKYRKFLVGHGKKLIVNVVCEFSLEDKIFSGSNVEEIPGRSDIFVGENPSLLVEFNKRNPRKKYIVW